MTKRENMPPTLPDQDVASQPIRFKCLLCRQPLEAEVDMMGAEIECPNCKKMIRVPLHVFSINPFRRPIRKFLSDIVSIQWHLPYFPQVIEVLVLVFVLAITALLYLSVGIASQVSGIFQSLMLDARQQIKTGSLIEKSAYAVAAGIYILLWLPFWTVLLPFSVLGWLWKHLGYFGLVIAFILSLFLYFATTHQDWFTTTVKQLLNTPAPVPSVSPVPENRQ